MHVKTQDTTSTHTTVPSQQAKPTPFFQAKPTAYAPVTETENAYDPATMHNECIKADKLIGGQWRQPPKEKVYDPSKYMAPNDPLSVIENQEVNPLVDNFKDWDAYPYGLIIVPGFTPAETKKPIRMDPTEKERLVLAKKDFKDGKKGKAPFIFVSGGAVYPKGSTPCFEGIEMKHELADMGVPKDRIIVDAAAQHSTTNIRNAGRYMLQHKIPKPQSLITTSGGEEYFDLLHPLKTIKSRIFSQDFLFSNPIKSRFHKRSEKELGYRVGELKDAEGIGHSAYTPGEQANTPGKDQNDL